MKGFRISPVVLAVIVLASVAAACASVPATPVPPVRQASPIVTAQLDSAVTLMASQGLSLVGEYRTGWLNDGGEQVLRVDLAGGRTYVITGVCDLDCGDLDLELTNASGETIDSDYLADDVPIVGAEGEPAGTYDLAVSMAACSVEPCGYGVAVFVN